MYGRAVVGLTVGEARLTTVSSASSNPEPRHRRPVVEPVAASGRQHRQALGVLGLQALRAADR
jgi:hypothetical protein